MENVINFDLLKEYDGTLKDVLKVWQKEKSYSIDDIIQYKGNYLKCTTAGTSGTTTLNFTGLDVGDTITDGTVVWELVEPPRGKGIDFYTVGESYEVGDIVIYNGSIYQCITAHTATSTFDNTKWEEINKSGIPYYSQDTYYKVDDQVVYNNKIYKCITAHTSTSTFDNTKWTEISAGGSGGMSDWQASYSYDSGDIVLFGGVIYKANTTHTSSSNFSTDSSNWDAIYTNIRDFAQNTFYKAGSIVINNNKLYKCLSDYTSSNHIYDTVLVYNDPDMKVQSSNPVTYDFDLGDEYELVEISVYQYDSTAYIIHIDYYGSTNGVNYYNIGEMSDSSRGGYDKVAEVSVNSAIRYVRAEVTAQFAANIGFDNFKFYTGTLNWVEISAPESSGVQIPTGVQAARVTLWEGNQLINNSTPVLLNDAYTNYDVLEFSMGVLGNSGFNGTVTQIIDVKTIPDVNYYRIASPHPSVNFQMELKFSDTTHFYIYDYYQNAGDTASVFKVTGIKYIQPDSYSTEEKLIGTWIDGKPLYRKVFTNVANNFDTELSSSNVSIKKFYGEFKTSSSVWMIPNHEDRLVILNSGVIEYSPSYPMEVLVVEYTKN